MDPLHPATFHAVIDSEDAVTIPIQTVRRGPAEFDEIILTIRLPWKMAFISLRSIRIRRLQSCRP